MKELRLGNFPTYSKGEKFSLLYLITERNIRERNPLLVLFASLIMFVAPLGVSGGNSRVWF
jgi:hypothetical protein